MSVSLLLIDRSLELGTQSKDPLKRTTVFGIGFRLQTPGNMIESMHGAKKTQRLTSVNGLRSPGYHRIDTANAKVQTGSAAARENLGRDQAIGEEHALIITEMWSRAVRGRMIEGKDVEPDQL